MDRVSLTYFVDFVVKAGTPKLTVVRNFKNRDEYDPQVDFYKQVRDGIIDMHQANKPKGALDSLLEGLADPKRSKGYPLVVAGYKKFLGNKQCSWFSPPSGVWASGGTEVSINPEVGLTIGGVQHVIKLYFKTDPPLAKNRIDIVTHLMNKTLVVKAPSATFGILDVRNAKLHTPPVPIPGLDALLAGEAASFAAMYAAI